MGGELEVILEAYMLPPKQATGSERDERRFMRRAQAVAGMKCSLENKVGHGGELNDKVPIRSCKFLFLLRSPQTCAMLGERIIARIIPRARHWALARS